MYVTYPIPHSFIGLSEDHSIEEAGDNYKIKCKLTYPESVSRESVRVHVFASYFNYSNNIHTLREKYIRYIAPKPYKAETPKSVYLNNQNLSD